VAHTYTGANSYSVTLTVTNDRGVPASTTQTVVVGATTLPTAAFTTSPAAPGVGEMVFFNAAPSAAAVGRSISSYQWLFGDGEAAGGISTSHKYQTAGTFTVTLTVADDLGQNKAQTGSVTVGATLPTADFDFTPTTPVADAAVFFNAALSKAGTGRTIKTYSWTFGDGTAPANGITASHRYAIVGRYVVTLVVVDDRDQRATVTKPVSIGNPVEFSFSPTTPTTADTVFFTASPSTTNPDRTVVSYAWDFGDGSSATESPTNHKFGVGTFNVTLTATDNLGQKLSVTHLVTVTKPS
jgi:PKD repeat protein